MMTVQETLHQLAKSSVDFTVNHPEAVAGAAVGVGLIVAIGAALLTLKVGCPRGCSAFFHCKGNRNNPSNAEIARPLMEARV